MLSFSISYPDLIKTFLHFTLLWGTSLKEGGGDRGWKRGPKTGWREDYFKENSLHGHYNIFCSYKRSWLAMQFLNMLFFFGLGWGGNVKKLSSFEIPWLWYNFFHKNLLYESCCTGFIFSVSKWQKVITKRLGPANLRVQKIDWRCRCNLI